MARLWKAGPFPRLQGRYICENELPVQHQIVTLGGEITPEEEEVMLVFPKPKKQMTEEAGLKIAPIETVAVGLNELLRRFKSYKVDSIELSVEASGKTGGVLNLFVSAEGKGGMKVVLKPKQTET